MSPLTSRRRNGSQTDASQRKPSRKHRSDYRLILFMGLLILIGLMVLFAISPYQIHRINMDGGSLDQSHYMLKQVTYLLIGLGAFAIATFLPLEIWRKFAGRLVVSALGLCVILAILGAVSAPQAMCFNGACRWFDLGFVSFQPSEFLKFSVMIFVAVFLGQKIRSNTINNLPDTLGPILIILGVVALVVVGLQKDMGTGITILGMVLVMLIIAGVKGRLLALGVGALSVVGILMIVVSPHRIDRVTTFLSTNGVNDPASYHIEMAKIAIGSGGFFGRGLGGGVQAFGYLPEALNDSIFAVLGEIFGFVGLIVIIGLFAALLRRIMHTVEHVVDPTMQLLAAGAFGWLGTHVVVNMGAMTGLLPLTGVTLPFLSFGGTSLLFMMAALGIVYQISRYTTFQNLTERSGKGEIARSRRGVGRARNSSPSRYKRTLRAG